MGRINPREIEKYEKSGTQSEWFKLKNDGDVARVQFLYHTYDDLDTFLCHKVKVGDYERYVNCPRDYDSPIDDCPLCAAGLELKPVFIVAMYDVNSKTIKLWERGKSFRQKLESLFNRYPDLSKYVFEIERHGAAGDKKTSYEIYPMPELKGEDISNIEKPKFIGGFILDKTADELQYYLDNGEFKKTEDSEVTTRRSRRG